MPNPFGISSLIFDAPVESNETREESEDGVQSDKGSEADEDEELITAMALTTLESTVWVSAPSYPALYLSTVSEYLPPAPKTNVKFEEVHTDDDDSKTGRDISWAMEGYENSLEVDHAFERFSKRVGYEAEQCIRYVAACYTSSEC